MIIATASLMPTDTDPYFKKQFNDEDYGAFALDVKQEYI